MLAPLLLLALGLTRPAPAADGQVFACCGRPGVDAVVEAWLDVHAALAAGKAPGDAMTRLAEAAGGRFPAREREVASDLAKQASALASADLATARDGVADVARGVLWLALRAEGGATEVVQVRCAGRGTWLQRAGSEPKSPWGERCAQVL